MNKEEMIRKLVAHSVNIALTESKHYWLNDLFERGFAGYRNLSRSELMREMQMRGLEPENRYEAEDPDHFEDLDADDYEDPDITVPLRAASAD